jgi:DNA-binding transcriptional regulator YhcF (GntR family)
MQVLAPSQNGSLDERKQQFRTTIEPALHRARQLGLNNKQIREVISSLLQDQQP